MELEVRLLRFRAQGAIGRFQPVLLPSQENALATVERLFGRGFHENDRARTFTAGDRETPGGLRRGPAPHPDQEPFEGEPLRIRQPGNRGFWLVGRFHLLTG